MSGRFPESDSTDEFADNLYNKVDMITVDDRRWPTDLYGMNPRMGKLKNIDKFDGLFFGITSTMTDVIDPQSRIVLETTYEAIVDAGINPQSLRGSDTGVYIGFSSFGMPEGLPEDVQPDSQSTMTETLLWLPGAQKCLYANRISFVYDFRGPSMIIDTACSSSLVAFNTAFNDIRLGKCRQAIVGGTQICLQALSNHIFQSTRLNAADGIPKVWDESADGFVRGETVSCFLLQRKSDAKRIYATVLNSGVNIDGNKRMGMFFPSAESQEELMVQVYKEANVDPRDVNYFEAHATGTKVGDPQEARAIYNAYCGKPKREGVLPVGLLKSNIGHAEGASGASSVTKVLLAYENECIAPSLHLNKIKENIKELCPPLQPVTENMKYTPGIAGINNFGVGGVNAHVLLEPNYKVADEDSLNIADTIPRIVNICCRTESALNSFFKWIEDNPQKVSRDLLALVTNIMKVEPYITSSGFPYRGSIIIKKTCDNKYDYKKQWSLFTLKSKRPIYFLFPGLGGQWVGMAKALMPIKIFADKIEECHEILKPYDIDLKHLLLSDDNNSMNSMTNKFCATTAIEIALFDVINALGITPDGIIGHSFGEIAAAYADGALTAKEALLVTYYRGVVTESDKKIPKGLMAVVGMSWSEAKKICPKGVSVVCNNGKDTVVISGLYKETKQMVEEVNKKGVFVRELQSHDIPYHSEYLMSSANKLINELKKVVPNPKPRSKSWISTALLDSDVDDVLKTASAEYFVHNLISPVYFYNKFKNIPSDAIVLEIGPHGLFSKAVKETLESGTYVSLIRKDSNDTNLDMLLTSIAKLYELGLNPNIENLYPRVEWPVARSTQSISSLIKWDHSYSCNVRKFPDYFFRSTASDLNEIYNPSQTMKAFLPEHCIDGNMLYPATGYLMLAWRRMAAQYGKLWNQLPVVFEDVQFRRPIFLSDTDITRIKVKYHDVSGEFAILEAGNVTCVGKVRTTDEYALSLQNILIEETEGLASKDFETTLTADDIYKDLKILGYDYGPKFRRIQNIKTDNFDRLYGEIQWDGNWVTFMDSVLQTMAIAMAFRKMMVPVMIKSLRCDPKTLYEGVAKYKQQFVDPKYEEKVSDDAINDLIEKRVENDEVKEVEGILNTNSVEYIEELFGKEFYIYPSVIPFMVDMNSRMIITHGVEVENLLALPIQRKQQTQDLRLESYQFLPNEDSMAIDEYNKQTVKDYIKICSSMANLIKQSIDTNNNNNNKCNKSVDEYVKKSLSDIKDNHIMLKTLNELYKGCLDENRNIDTNQVLSDLQKNMEYDMSFDIINDITKNEHLIRAFVDIVSESIVPKKEINVLEVNLTNGLLVKEIDNQLATSHIYPIDVNYTVAVKSLDSISDDLKKESFKWIEWDYKKSVFPNDIPSANFVIIRDSSDMWEVDTEKQLQDVFDLIADKGFLLCVFRYQFTEPELALNQMNGKQHIDNFCLSKRITDFVKTAQSVGFNIIGRKTDTIGSVAIMFRKLFTEPKVPKKDNIIEINTTNTEKWFEKLKEKIIEMQENDETDENLWLIANDSQKNGIVGLVNCLRLEPGGETIRCIFDYDNLTKTVNFKEKPFSDILSNDLPINVLKNGKIGTYRHYTLTKDYDKKESTEYFLNVGHNRDLASLQWYDLKNLVSAEESYDFINLPANKIPCNIYCAGMNFRDVMFATGRIASGPQMLFTDCLIGFEFAGRRIDTGERVCGFDMSRCYATSIDVNSDLVSPVPDNWSMEDAVTILSTYSTVWYGLIERAHMVKGESILIHSGAGGVGQAAISICQYYGCDIFVTVGTEDKRKFLIENYKIPEDRIFSSRNTQFKYRIKEITKGKGVDMVLNSLSGDKLDASYECVADCGRFVEIGKYDLQMNKQLGMFAFLRDISFIGVSVDQKLYLKRGFTKKFFDWMHENATNGMIRPINKNVFEAEEIEKAFRYMTTGKHIGKIVIRMRDEEEAKVAKTGFNPSKKLMVTRKTYFNPNKTYIITGGLGGFGMEFIHWMLFLGARRFVLTSRKGVRTDYQKFILERLKALGGKLKQFDTNVLVSTHDTNTSEGTKQLLSEAQKLGPIGGVFHLALVLNDCLLENHTFDKFQETIDSKTKNFENLDRITRELSIDLDYFVVFSSVACGKGNAGQSNYGFANSVCERICESRRRDGLHGLAIQWGPIGDVGVLADSDINNSLAAVVKQRVNSCLEIMDKLLQSDNAVVSCLMRAKREITSGTKESKLVNQVWVALGIDPKTTPNHLTLGEIGMESMFAVELQQGLEREYNIKVTLNDIKNITIGMMKDFEKGKVDEMKQFADEIKSCRAKLSKVKFIIPNEQYTRLNNVTTGKPIYFLPPLEGIFASLEGLAQKLDRPVICLNWIREMENLKTIKEINRYYCNLMKVLEPKGDFDILGHFYGALLAMKMLKKAPVGKAVIIDMLSEVTIDEEMITDDYLMDTIIAIITKDMPYVMKVKLKRDISTKPDVPSKLEMISAEVRGFCGKSLTGKDLDEILTNSFKRAKLFTTHRLNMKNKYKKMKMDVLSKYMKINGKVLVIKPYDFSNDVKPEEISEKIKNAYFLPEKGLEGKLNFETVEAGDKDYETDKTFDKIAESINRYMSKK
ncbi:fatty acid synthase-like [Oppia nitens]|uniref:fatty acid synthase-like n=1 Tax=Oppia nitens TaxID=1686743 RepID=UPI0023DA1578|nr:fatty acid synthase-like [Oppia nitens]